MAEKVRLAGRLPGSIENNGMLSIAPDLLKQTNHVRLAVIWYDVLKTEHNNDSGDDIAVLRIGRIEPMGDVGEVSEALQEIVLVAAEKRLGSAPLPFGEIDPGAAQDVD